LLSTAAWKTEEPPSVPDSKSSVGVARSFEEVYEEHVQFVWRTIRAMGIPKELVPDAAQDVFVVVHRKMADFDGRHAFKTWLFHIVYRVVCEYRRKLRRAATQQPLDETIELPSVREAESTQWIERHEATTLLAELLAELDDEKRAVLVLAEIEEMTAPEIAAATQTPLNTVYTRLRRARVQLTEALAARKKGLR
jgi:RNA polymerase sigma-70 factor (ECF subfamily)